MVWGDRPFCRDLSEFYKKFLGRVHEFDEKQKNINRGLYLRLINEHIVPLPNHGKVDGMNIWNDLLL